jgi:hypothetical protein
MIFGKAKSIKTKLHMMPTINAMGAIVGLNPFSAGSSATKPEINKLIAMAMIRNIKVNGNLK